MKKSLLILTIITGLFVVEASAQLVNYLSVNWDMRYQHTLDNNFSNESRKVIVNQSTNHIYVLADVTSNLDMAGNYNQLTNYYTMILKYDNSGALLDVATINVNQHIVSGFDNKSGFGLELDAAGNVFVGYMSYDASNGTDVKIGKYDSNLNNLWTYTFNPTSTDYGIEMKLSNVGVAYAVVKSVYSTSTIRHRVIKASGAGTSTTPFYGFNSGDDNINSIAIDGASNVYATGYRLISGVKSVLVTSFTNTGILRWNKVENCGTVTGDDMGKNITIGFDGNVYITGSSLGTVIHGLDVVTMKFNAFNGKKVWQNFINFTLTDGGVFVNAESPSVVCVSWVAGNNVYLDQIAASTGVSGERTTYSPIPDNPHTSLNGATISDMKRTSSGHIYITGNINASNGVQPFSASYLIKISMSQRNFARVDYQAHVLGTFSQSNSSTAIALNNVDKRVLWVQNVSENASTHNQESIQLLSIGDANTFRISNDNEQVTVSTFPSPASSEVSITANEVIQGVTLYNTAGQVVIDRQNEIFNEKVVQIQVENLQPGLYLAKIEFESGHIQNTKIIIK